MEVSGQLHAPAALPPGIFPRYPFDIRLGRPQSQFGRDGENKYIFPCRESYPGRLARSLVSVLAEPSRLINLVTPVTTLFSYILNPMPKGIFWFTLLGWFLVINDVV
jgi:hypothetical protein